MGGDLAKGVAKTEDDYANIYRTNFLMKKFDKNVNLVRFERATFRSGVGPAKF